MEYFLFTTVSRLPLGPAQPPIRRILEVLTPGMRRPEREADQSPKPDVEDGNAWSYTSIPQYVFMA